VGRGVETYECDAGPAAAKNSSRLSGGGEAQRVDGFALLTAVSNVSLEVGKV
jgi:hypothetical protein